MTYLVDTSVPERIRWFIQFSQVHQKWICEQCHQIARGVTFWSKNKDKEKVRRTRNEYATIAHTDIEGKGNRLVHKPNCFVWLEIFKVLGRMEPPVDDEETVYKVITRKCGCTFAGSQIEKPCETHEHLWGEGGTGNESQEETNQV